MESAGDVTLSAVDTSAITAVIGSVSSGIGIGGVAGVGVAIGASVARNYIGYDEDGNGVEGSARVQAYLEDAELCSEGSLFLSATAAGTIEAVVPAMSVAVSGGIGGFAGSGSGVWAENHILSRVGAFIDGSGGIQARGAITLDARNGSAIDADAEAASVAANFSIGGALSIGAALAVNEIDTGVYARIDDATSVNSLEGGIALTALDDSSILCSSVAASVAGKPCGGERRRGFLPEHHHQPDHCRDRQRDRQNGGGPQETAPWW